jgi:hypothetical protein
MICIFCRGESVAKRVEHILPESLGGKDWAELLPGIVCDSCNQYFGAKVEALALGSYPFLPFRVLLGIPTKRRRSPTMEHPMGIIRSGSLGNIELIPRDGEIAEDITAGHITKFLIPAVPENPLAVCRLLLKMGIEVIGKDSVETALQSKYNEARTFARCPSRGARWWFIIITNHTALFKKFKQGVSYQDWANGVKLEIAEIEGEEVFHLKLLDVSLITPMRPVIVPAPELSQQEPEWTLHQVTA